MFECVLPDVSMDVSGSETIAVTLASATSLGESRSTGVVDVVLSNWLPNRIRRSDLQTRHNSVFVLGALNFVHSAPRRTVDACKDILEQ